MPPRSTLFFSLTVRYFVGFPVGGSSGESLTLVRLIPVGCLIGSLLCSHFCRLVALFVKEGCMSLDYTNAEVLVFRLGYLQSITIWYYFG